jgi:hypothetical protein
MNERDIFLETASRIGRRLVNQALWNGSVCTWQIMTPDKSHPQQKRAISALASGTLYQGTAGIALFLAELYKLTREDETKRAAEGAIRHAMAEARSLPPVSFGFHTGRVGIAYAAARIATIFDKPEYLKEASHLLQPLAGNEHHDQGIDVIAGAAGAIPALIQLSEVCNHDLLMSMAMKLGDHLVQIARKEPYGWSWTTLTPSSVRNLTGLAHGAAGIGYALLELYRTTGSDQYLYAAEQAFLYERQFYNAEVSNWPDFRHTELGEYLFNGQIDELKAIVIAGKLPPYVTRYMSGWCHGAPGIGLTRTRAFEILYHQAYKDEAQAAIKATETSLNERGSNFSLCHGLAGNCELLLYAADIFDDAKLRSRAEACGLLGWETIEKAGKSWPCGTVGGVSDPSLMLGEAGIGYFYLRLFSSATLSVLFIRPSRKTDENRIGQSSYRELQEQYVGEYFGRTLQILKQIETGDHNVLSDASTHEPIRESEVARAYQTINRLIQNKDRSAKQFLADAFLPERVKYELSLTLTDFTEEFLDSLRKPAVEAIEWNEVIMQLQPCTRLVQTRWDWDRWLPKKVCLEVVEPEPAAVCFLLYRFENKIHVRRLDKFAALVLRCLETPSSLEHITASVAQSFSAIGQHERKLLQEKIVLQLQHAYRAGIVECKNGAFV